MNRISLRDIVRVAGWFAFRQLRCAAFTLAGRNRLVRGPHTLTAAEDWHSVAGLIGARRLPPQVIQQTAAHTTWQTSMGTVVAPHGAGADYIGRLTSEMPASVYALSNSDRIVLDAGANVGMFSLHAFQSGVEQVIAFEPSPGNIDCLKLNLRTYLDKGKFRVIEKGVWSHDAVLRFSTRNTNNPGGHYIVEDGDMEVPVTSIDSVVENLNLQRLDYIKMDVEGAELAALEGARKTIERFRPRLCIATEHTDDLHANAEAVIEVLRKQGYDYVCTEAHPYRSPSRGWMLTPFCILFTPAGRKTA